MQSLLDLGPLDERGARMSSRLRVKSRVGLVGTGMRLAYLFEAKLRVLPWRRRLTLTRCGCNRPHVLRAANSWAELKGLSPRPTTPPTVRRLLAPSPVRSPRTVLRPIAAPTVRPSTVKHSPRKLFPLPAATMPFPVNTLNSRPTTSTFLRHDGIPGIAMTCKPSRRSALAPFLVCRPLGSGWPSLNEGLRSGLCTCEQTSRPTFEVDEVRERDFDAAPRLHRCAKDYDFLGGARLSHLLVWRRGAAEHGAVHVERPRGARVSDMDVGQDGARDGPPLSV